MSLQPVDQLVTWPAENQPIPFSSIQFHSFPFAGRFLGASPQWNQFVPSGSFFPHLIPSWKRHVLVSFYWISQCTGRQHCLAFTWDRLFTVYYPLQSRHEPFFCFVFLHSNRLVLEGLPFLVCIRVICCCLFRWQYCDFNVYPRKQMNEMIIEIQIHFYTASNNLLALWAFLNLIVPHWVSIESQALWLVDELRSLGGLANWTCLFWELV